MSDKEEWETCKDCPYTDTCPEHNEMECADMRREAEEKLAIERAKVEKLKGMLVEERAYALYYGRPNWGISPKEDIENWESVYHTAKLQIEKDLADDAPEGGGEEKCRCCNGTGFVEPLISGLPGVVYCEECNDNGVRLKQPPKKDPEGGK